MLDLPLALHIGYHKTGTTFLQMNVFGNHPEILCLGRPWINDKVRECFHELKFTPDLDFDPVHCRDHFQQVAERIYLNQSPNRDFKVLVVTSESIHSGPEWFGMLVQNSATKLQSAFFPCKIIIGIRNQKDYIESNYKEYVLHGGKIEFKKFLYSSFACNYCLLPKLQYDKIISLYRGLFGDDSVFVYLQERLKSCHSAELSRLMDFLGVDNSVKFEQRITYSGLSKFSIECTRWLNKLVASDYVEQYYNVRLQKRPRVEYARWKFIRILRRLETRVGSNFTGRYMNQSDVEYVSDYFRDSNRQLSRMLDVDIEEFGYDY